VNKLQEQTEHKTERWKASKLTGRSAQLIRVCLVDDHAILRRGMTQFLEAQGDLRVVGEADCGLQALELVRTVRPEVLLLDINLPDQSGIELMPHLLAKDPSLKIVVFSGLSEEQYALTLLRGGAMAYLSKQCDPQEIVSAIRAVASGRRFLTSRVGDLLAQQLYGKSMDGPLHTQLSERELQVFLRLSKGETVGKIAQKLSLSVKSVSTYRSRTMEKLSLESNSDLTYYALKHQLIH
jgi:two-component system, NarL family, invasion response regulator UvrY